MRLKGEVVTVVFLKLRAKTRPVRPLRWDAKTTPFHQQQSATVSEDVKNVLMNGDCYGRNVSLRHSIVRGLSMPSLTFLIIPKDGKDAQKRAALKQFIQYVVTDGQQTASD